LILSQASKSHSCIIITQKFTKKSPICLQANIKDNLNSCKFNLDNRSFENLINTLTTEGTEKNTNRDNREIILFSVISVSSVVNVFEIYSVK
jgi:hypothetical protein